MRDARRTPYSETMFARESREFGGEKDPRKGTTPARGEEAEVVVYQPRGVGLIHTRP